MKVIYILLHLEMFMVEQIIPARGTISEDNWIDSCFVSEVTLSLIVLLNVYYLPCLLSFISEPEPMEICTSSVSLPCEIPSSDVTVLEGHTSEVQSSSHLSPLFRCIWFSSLEIYIAVYLLISGFCLCLESQWFTSCIWVGIPSTTMLVQSSCLVFAKLFFPCVASTLRCLNQNSLILYSLD